MIMKEFDAIYYKKTKHRKRCYVCSKLISDGEKVHMKLIKEKKYYPVKGTMAFTTWKFGHSDCLQTNAVEWCFTE